jgi:hypothetical protein
MVSRAAPDKRSPDRPTPGSRDNVPGSSRGDEVRRQWAESKSGPGRLIQREGRENLTDSIEGVHEQEVS